jgi:NADPH-dependent ferric siderophore reductase
MTAVLERPIAFDSASVTVTAVRDLSPHLRRITFTGPRLADAVTAGPDQRIKLFLPPPGRTDLVLPSGDWYPVWLAMPAEDRVVMRTYTVRALRPALAELDIDFALHGRTGPASTWATDVAVGDTVGLLLPFAVDTSSVKGLLQSGVDYVPPASSAHRRLVADETALPALEGILEQLPPEVTATVFVEVPDVADIRHLPSPAKVDLTWVPHGCAPDGSGPRAVTEAVRTAILPQGIDYAWVAGESGDDPAGPAASGRERPGQAADLVPGLLEARPGPVLKDPG